MVLSLTKSPEKFLTCGIGITPPIIGGGAPTMYGIGGMPGMPIGGCPGYDISDGKETSSMKDRLKRRDATIS